MTPMRSPAWPCASAGPPPSGTARLPHRHDSDGDPIKKRCRRLFQYLDPGPPEPEGQRSSVRPYTQPARDTRRHAQRDVPSWRCVRVATPGSCGSRSRPLSRGHVVAHRGLGGTPTGFAAQNPPWQVAARQPDWPCAGAKVGLRLEEGGNCLLLHRLRPGRCSAIHRRDRTRRPNSLRWGTTDQACLITSDHLMRPSGARHRDKGGYVVHAR